jgi:phage recombination protein Bet
MSEDKLAVVSTKQELPEVSLTAQDIQTLVTVGALPAGCPPDVIRFFAKACAESRLSPFKRQVHLIKRWSRAGDRYTIQTGIDGYRAIANRTGQYAGNDDCTYDDGKTEFQLLSKNMGCVTATATVYRVVGGIRCPFAATAAWESYCPKEDKNAFMWNKMPFLMLGKCAEALALRKAFPEELGGIYTDEEMIQVEVVSPPAPTHQVDSEHAGEPIPPQPAATPIKAAINARSASAKPVTEVDGITTCDVMFEDYKVVNGKTKAGKPWTLFDCTFSTDSGSQFKAATFRTELGEKLDVHKGQPVTIRHQPGRKAGTIELLSVEPQDQSDDREVDEIPMGDA